MHYTVTNALKVAMGSSGTQDNFRSPFSWNILVPSGVPTAGVQTLAHMFLGHARPEWSMPDTLGTHNEAIAIARKAIMEGLKVAA